MFSIITKVPNFFLFIFLFIATFLLSFLLLSCYSSAEAYADVFLTSYSFNEQEFLEVTLNSTKSDTKGEVTKFSINIGYVSFCLDYDKELTCTTFDNIDKLDKYPLISVETGKKDNSTIDLVKLAEKFNEICYSYVLMVVLIFTLVCLGMVFWCMIPLLPGKPLCRKLLCGLSVINALLWGVGAMLQHEAAKASKSLVPMSSMNLILVKSGNRAEAMAWTVFSFLCVVCIGNIVLLVKSMTVLKQPSPPPVFK